MRRVCSVDAHPQQQQQQQTPHRGPHRLVAARCCMCVLASLVWWGGAYPHRPTVWRTHTHHVYGLDHALCLLGHYYYCWTGLCCVVAAELPTAAVRVCALCACAWHNKANRERGGTGTVSTPPHKRRCLAVRYHARATGERGARAHTKEKEGHNDHMQNSGAACHHVCGGMEDESAVIHQYVGTATHETKKKKMT